MQKPAVQAIDSGKPESIPDHFKLENLRLNPSFTERAGVKKLRTTVPVRKPNKQDFIQVNPDPAYRNNFAMIELKDEREEYLVIPEVAEQLPGEIVFKTIYTAINRQGVVFLWSVRLPTPDEKQNAWWDSAREAAEMAMTKWLRVRADMSLGAYEMGTPEREDLADPDWTKVEESFEELLRIAFRGRLVTSLDHPVLKRLRGLI
jgi:hypothetical protein